MTREPAHIGTPASDAVRLAEVVRRAYEEGLSPHGGFLPPEIPLTSLPGPLARYVDICRELPRHYHGPDAHVRPWLGEQLRGRGATSDTEAEAVTVAQILQVVRHMLRGLASRSATPCEGGNQPEPRRPG